MFTKSFIIKYQLYFLGMCWLLSTFFYLHTYGIVTTLEAEKYITEANRLLNHQGLSAPRFIFYSPTILIIWFSLLLRTGFYGALIIQLLYNIVTLYLFYKALNRLFSISILPVAIILLLILFSPYSSWNVYLFTESVFYSSILLLLTALIENTYNKKPATFLLIIAALILVIFSRPLGVLFIFPVLLYFFIGLKKRTRLIMIPFAVIGFILLIYICNIIFSTTYDATITLAASQECIICGVHPPVHSVIKLTNQGSQFFQLCYYLKNNFGHFLNLGIIRLRYFFMMTRNYYSSTHNIFLLVFIIPLYIFSIIGIFIKKEKKYLPIYIFQLSSILFFALTIMLQCDDFHNRFILALFPFFLILSAKTIEYYLVENDSKEARLPSLS